MNISQHPEDGVHIQGVHGEAHRLTECSPESCGREAFGKVSAPEPYDLVGAAIKFEYGMLEPEDVLVLFSHLISTGTVWILQGSYGRTAETLISQGFISEAGEINWELVDEEFRLRETLPEDESFDDASDNGDPETYNVMREVERYFADELTDAEQLELLAHLLEEV
jgi:hypothetical protein